jgi:hypothetical protein
LASSVDLAAEHNEEHGGSRGAWRIKRSMEDQEVLSDWRPEWAMDFEEPPP